MALKAGLKRLNRLAKMMSKCKIVHYMNLTDFKDLDLRKKKLRRDKDLESQMWLEENEFIDTFMEFVELLGSFT